MNKIGIISDTHVPGRLKKIPSILLKALADVDLIIHLGDIDSEKTLKTFQAIAPVEVVKGNHDKTIKHLVTKKIIKIEDLKIGLIHGHQLRINSLDVKKLAAKAFKKVDVKIICFGHSHQPFLMKENNILFLNPGSTTFSPDYGKGSFCLLYLKPMIRVEFVFFQ